MQEKTVWTRRSTLFEHFLSNHVITFIASSLPSGFRTLVKPFDIVYTLRSSFISLCIITDVYLQEFPANVVRGWNEVIARSFHSLHGVNAPAHTHAPHVNNKKADTKQNPALLRSRYVDDKERIFSSTAFLISGDKSFLKNKNSTHGNAGNQCTFRLNH